MTNRALIIVPLCFALFCPSCTRQDGPPLGRVTGLVTLDGAPVAGAGLEFIADAGGVAYGKTDASGHYQMSFGASRTGAIVGKNRVRITSGDHVAVGDKKYESTEVFPKKYNISSEQFVDVKKGSNRFDFACESGDFKPKQSISRGGN
jgi:hypothetical protein